MKLEIIATAGSMLLLGACVTRPATSAEYASCQAMERDMGVADRPDHGEMKGQGRNAMNLSHDRCSQLPSPPAPARPSSAKNCQAVRFIGPAAQVRPETDRVGKEGGR